MSLHFGNKRNSLPPSRRKRARSRPTPLRADSRGCWEIHWSTGKAAAPPNANTQGGSATARGLFAHPLMLPEAVTRPGNTIAPKTPSGTGPPESGQCRQTAVNVLNLTQPETLYRPEKTPLRSTQPEEAEVTSLHTPPPSLPNAPTQPGLRGSPHTPPFRVQPPGCTEKPLQVGEQKAGGAQTAQLPPARPPAPAGSRAPTAAAPSRPRGPQSCGVTRPAAWRRAHR